MYQSVAHLATPTPPFLRLETGMGMQQVYHVGRVAVELCGNEVVGNLGGGYYWVERGYPVCHFEPWASTVCTRGRTLGVDSTGGREGGYIPHTAQSALQLAQSTGLDGGMHSMVRTVSLS